MKKQIVTIMLLIVLTLSVISTSAYAEGTNEYLIIKVDENYLVYVEGMTDKDFQYAMSDNNNLAIDSSELHYVNSVKDNDDNSVAFLDKEVSYLYVKEGTKLTVLDLNFSKQIKPDSLTNVENITEKIKTEIINIEERNEKVEEVTYVLTVGGLKITEDGDGTYEYVDMKLPATNYSDLKELANKLDGETDIYTRIKLLNEFNTIFNTVIDDANNNDMWQEVENKTIKQREDALKGDEYAILIKKTENGTETYDVKFLVSDRTETQKETTEVEKVVKSTAKLPVTYDTTIKLIAVLVVIVVAIIAVVILKNKANKKEKR